MKYVHIALDNEDFDALEKAKGKRTWREFILMLVPSEPVLERRDEK